MSIYTLFIIFVGIPLLGYTYQKLFEMIDKWRFPPSDYLLSIDNNDLHFSCKGNGKVAIILEAGAGGTSKDWSYIQSDLAKEAQVFAYDRAGLGCSDSGSNPRTSSQIVAELHQLLAAAQITSPKIFVGHSFGGFVAQHYVRAHPNDVVGLVLVEAMHECFIDTAPVRISELRKKELLRLKFGIFLSQFGLVRLFNLVQLPESMPNKIKPVVNAQNLRTQTVRTLYDEAISLEKSIEEIKNLPPVKANLPVAIISRYINPNEHTPENKHWRKIQETLSKLTTNTSMINSGSDDHFVHFTSPDLVLQTVRKLVKSL